MPEDRENGHDDLQDILSRLGSDDDEAVERDAIAAATTSSPRSTGRPSGPPTADQLTDPRDLTRPSQASGIVVDVGSGIEFDPSFATFGQRALGAIVDTVIVTLAALPGLVILQAGGSVLVSIVGLIVTLAGILAVIVLGARAIAKDGKWIGNLVAGTTVVDGINGSFVDVGRAALRMFARHLISPILLLGYLIAFTDGQRRTFHDRMTGTVVIRRPREVWTVDDG